MSDKSIICHDCVQKIKQGTDIKNKKIILIIILNTQVSCLNKL